MYKQFYVVKVTQAIDRNTEEGELAWEDATTHHCIPFVKDGCYELTRFWTAYSDHPYENLETCKEDWGDEWTHQGMLAKVIADYILKDNPDFEDWESVLLDFRW